MLREMVMCLIGVLIIAAYGLIRRRKDVFHEDRHQDGLLCIVSYYDRSATLPLIESYFDRCGIRVSDLRRSYTKGDQADLFVDEYQLWLPNTVNQADVVSELSIISTVQSVHIKPL